MPRQLDVRDVSVAYGNDPVVRSVSFTLKKGDIGCLLGPSGCGKTTLLRAIAGFEPVTGGEVHIQGRLVSGTGQTLAPEQRRVGMVFQDFALFPHLTAERNVAFGLRHLSRGERRGRVAELLRLVGLEHAGRRYPHQLSGGMQQRVALARAMAPRPDILLLDEPFSSMDAELREQLAREVRQVLKRDGITAVLVTHDQLEAFAMADRIGVLGAGRLRQWGTGFDLYHEPADRFVADFIGQGIMLPGRVVDDRQIETELGLVSGRYAHGLSRGRSAELLLRPDDVIHDDSSPLKAEVVTRAFRGAEYLYGLRLESGIQILCMVQSHHDHAPGERIGIRLDLEHLVAFPTDAPSSGAEGATLSVVSLVY
jgi:iron(III) transport system ATP-binding protein